MATVFIKRQAKPPPDIQHSRNSVNSASDCLHGIKIGVRVSVWMAVSWRTHCLGLEDISQEL